MLANWVDSEWSELPKVPLMRLFTGNLGISTMVALAGDRLVEVDRCRRQDGLGARAEMFYQRVRRRAQILSSNYRSVDCCPVRAARGG